MKKVIISIGHDKNVKGASGVYKNIRYYEYDVNKNVTEALKEELKQYNHNIIISDRELKSDIKFINSDRDIDLAIELHNNSFNTEVEGYETLTYGKDESNVHNTFHKKLSAIWKMDRGIKYRTDLGYLRETHCKAIILENGFIDNQKDLSFISGDKYPPKIAKAILDALLELKYISKKTESKPSSDKDFNCPHCNNIIKVSK